MKGRVKWFNKEKGFGFIKVDGEEDIFIHYSNISMPGYKTLKEDELVEFDLIKTDKGNQAENIKSLDKLQTIE